MGAAEIREAARRARKARDAAADATTAYHAADREAVDARNELARVLDAEGVGWASAHMIVERKCAACGERSHIDYGAWGLCIDHHREVRGWEGE